MTSDLIHDRGRGPEIVGTRITVYNLLPDFLDSTATEAQICQLYELTPEQVAAARAYVLNNPDTVLAEHMRIETKMSAGNPPEILEKARRTHAAFVSFKEWLDRRKAAEAQAATGSKPGEHAATIPSFREWLAEQEPGQVQGTSCMQGLLADVNVAGHLRYMSRLLKSLDLWPILADIGIRLMTLAELEWPRDITLTINSTPA
jgi:uncharacterized protein (DUF433 family)